ncbi:P-loop containing nucleoside triphosphate hydrolase protein [Blastocladiella britannica]|nr:P-loop containing nucleoside triphosphate hydrolase protein [Blastocladiella britannica]
MFPAHRAPDDHPATDENFDRVVTGPKGFLSRHANDEGLPAEVECGNIEYKLKLVNIAPDRLEHLVTQMKWRLSEGNGEALYEIGIADNGRLVGLPPGDLDESLRTLRVMAAKLAADCSIVRMKPVPSPTGANLKVAEVLVRKRVEEDHFLEIQVALMGGSDAGKSTILGVLTHSENDNGYGRARSRAFNHPHELTTGRTSSLSHELIGFDSSGNLINFATTAVHLPRHIVERSSKVVTLIDTCGHAKYLATTLAGITATQPHYAMLTINAAQPLDVTREHLGVILVLRIPFFIVVSKIDVTPAESIRETLSSLVTAIKGPGSRLVPVIVKNEDDLVASIPHVGPGGVVPIFLCSSVTGANISLLTQFLNLLPVPPLPVDDADVLVHQPVKFQIRDIYDVPHVGTVIGGQVLAGTIKAQPIVGRCAGRSGKSAKSAAVAAATDASPLLLLGPFEDGSFRRVRVTSAHRFCRPVQFVKAGQSATLAVHWIDAPPPLPPLIPTRLIGTPESEGNGTTSASPGRRTSRASVSAASPVADTNTPPVTTTEQPVGDSTAIPASALRRGMVLVGSADDAAAAWTVDVQLHVLYHASELTVGQTAIVYCGAVRQAARVVDCDRRARTGDRARVRFRFLNAPEWVPVGATMLAREGRAGKMKCVGTILDRGLGDSVSGSPTLPADRSSTSPDVEPVAL